MSGITFADKSLFSNLNCLGLRKHKKFKTRKGYVDFGQKLAGGD